MDELVDIFLTNLRYWNDRHRGVPRIVYVNPSDYEKLLEGLCLAEGYWIGIKIVSREDIIINELLFV